MAMQATIMGRLPVASLNENLATTETPILRLYRQHREINEAAKRHVPVSTGKAVDDELDRLFYRRADQIEGEMMALPCTCAADFAAKVIVGTVRGSFFPCWETDTLWAEARALVG